MRLLMEVLIPAAKGNTSKADGSMHKALQAFIDAAKPEVAYFYLRDGKRAAFFVYEESDPGRIVAHNEALFAALDAEIRLAPVVSQAELMREL